MNTAEMIDVVAEAVRLHLDVISVRHYENTDLDGLVVRTTDGGTYEVTITQVQQEP